MEAVQPQEPKPFRGFLGPFSLNRAKMTAESEANELGSKMTSNVDKDIPLDPTEAESDSDSAPSAHGPESSNGDAVEAVTDNPPQKRASFLDIFRKPESEKKLAEVEAKGSSSDDAAQLEETSSTDSNEENNEEASSPKKGPGFWEGLFNKKPNEEEAAAKPDGAEDKVDEGSEESEAKDVEEEAATDPSEAETTPPVKKGNVFGFFLKKDEPKADETEDADPAEGQKTTQEKQDEPEMPKEEPKSPEGEMGGEREVNFFGKLFQRKKKQEESATKESYEDTTVDDEPTLELLQNVTATTRMSIAENRRKSELSIAASIAASVDFQEESGDKTAEEEGKDMKPNFFFGLFGGDKKVAEESVEASAEKDASNESKRGSVYFDSKEADIELGGDTQGEEIARDLVLEAIQQIEKQTADDESNEVTDEDAEPCAATETLSEPRASVYFDSKEVDTYEYTEAASLDDTKEVPVQVVQNDDVLFSAEETGLEIEVEGGAIAPPPAALEDPYWDDNAKDSKERMCCSFLFR